MRKYFSMIAAGLLIGLLLLSGCKKNTYKVLLIDSGDFVSLKPEDTEQVAEWYTWTSDPGDAPSEKTIYFDGVQYDGVYAFSQGKEGFSGLLDTYRITDPAKGSEFSIDRESGELAGAILYTYKNYEAKDALLPVPEDPKANAISAAEKWADKLLKDSDEYERVDVGYADGLYAFRFIRVIEGTQALDYLGLAISDRGGLAYFQTSDPGWAKQSEKELDQLKDAPSKELVTAELQKRDASLIKIQDSYYGRTPDKKVVLIVNCEVQTKDDLVTAAKFIISAE